MLTAARDGLIYLALTGEEALLLVDALQQYLARNGARRLPSAQAWQAFIGDLFGDPGASNANRRQAWHG